MEYWQKRLEDKMDLIQDKRFEENIELFKHSDSYAAYRLLFSSPSPDLAFCQTNKGELNLVHLKEGNEFYFHSPAGAEEEARKIFEEQNLKNVDVVYFYGIGLGYVYDAFKNWLHENPQRQFVFLENDLDVLRCFLYTERASKVLLDPQVTMTYFQLSRVDYLLDLTHKDIEEIEFHELRFHQMLSRFSSLNPSFLTLPYYGFAHSQEALELGFKTLKTSSDMGYIIGELLQKGNFFFKNYYHNLLHLSESYLGTGLFGAFKNIPAIICGAGPSLDKNIHTLKQLTDKALIFAGGSSLNVLNSYGVLPHFGAGIDPNPEQSHRLLTNHSFQVPFFYRNRMQREAFDLIWGPRLYIPGVFGYPLTDWIDEQLGIKKEFNSEEGTNVIHFCTDLARLLGCNPIIFVGMDLALTDGRSYAKGIERHPLWLDQSNPYEVSATRAVAAPDIYGQPTQTRWEWIAESQWYRDYVLAHPEVLFLNATEGGIGFQFVTHAPLEDIADYYLSKPLDILNLVHAEIQHHPIPIRRGSILQVLRQIKIQLSQCQDYCQTIINEFMRYGEVLSSRLEPTVSPYTPLAALMETELEDTIIYQKLLKPFKFGHQVFAHQELAASKIGFQLDVLSQLLIYLNYYHFLNSVLEINLNCLNSAVARFILSPPPIITPHPTFNVAKVPGEIYQFEAGQLIIKDPELEIEIEQPFHPSETDTYTSYYANGTLKTQCFYREGRLHGLARSFAENGQLLAESWFIDGKRQGKMRQYYLSGCLYSLCCYKDGLLHGTQKYFFENGTPKAILHYKEGWLEGDVYLYNGDGKLIRELHYQNGVRHGPERMWRAESMPLMECRYENGIPVGTARQWDQEGKLIKDVMIREFPRNFDFFMWNHQGELEKRIIQGVEDFSHIYTRKQLEGEQLSASIQASLYQLQSLIQEAEVKHTGEKESQSLTEAKEELKTLIENIQSIENVQLDLQKKMQTYLEEADKQRERHNPSDEK
jgi:antitoxin component YwqK of YwqJK toxin-antitoxin module